jgi:pyruvate dehydrogenase E1 component beta subunit
MYAGQFAAPVVYRAPYGGGFGYGPSHSQALEAWFCHTPGLKVVAPATPRAAKGLLLAAIRDDSPVLFLEHKALYNLVGEVPEDDTAFEIGSGRIVHAGSDVTLVGYGRTVWLAVEAARRLAGRASVEVVDLRTLSPLDRPLVLASVRKTGRLVVVEDDCLSGGVGAEVVASVAEHATTRAPMRRVACADVPMPCCGVLERAALPHVDRVVQAVLQVLEGIDEPNDRHPENRRERDPRDARAVAAARG